MNARAEIVMSKTEFLRWSEGHDERHELVGGKLRKMIGTRKAHDEIVVNWIFALRQQLDRKAYLVHTPDFFTGTGNSSLRLPDVSVERRHPHQDARETIDPLLIIEVMSASSAWTDLNEKRDEYLSLPSLLAYVVAAQDARKIWVFLPGQEAPIERAKPDEHFELPALGLSISLDDIYFGIPE
jgi:Uma2 family endonuclease